jgi:ABC-type glycerol-3-phosphate transport system substrate-binding protein
VKDQFDWFIGEEDEEAVPLRAGSGRWLARSIWFLLVTAVITIALLSSWQITQNRLEQSEAEAVTAVQNLLDLEHDAFLRGDGDLYFSFYGSSSDWIAAQLQPHNMQATRAGFRVTRAELRDHFIWANLSWMENDTVYQRIAFFRQQEGLLTHVPAAPNYWGNWISTKEPWGELIFTERDKTWAAEIANFVTKTAAAHDGRIPFTLHIANDYPDTAVPGQLRIPSPRLIALDENGRPAGIFWDMLRQRLEAYLSPVTIRFALPPTELPGVHLFDYDQAATDFMAANPTITIELVNLDSWPDDLAQSGEYDGAAVPPTAAMIAAGHVYDLTDLAATDPAFDRNDSYDQIWQGTWWHGRMWAMPLAANLKLIFYEKEAFHKTDLPEPSLHWTWAEMAHYLTALDAAQVYSPTRPDLFFDVGQDTLFAYAYNWKNPCAGTIPANCRQAIPPENVAAALAWYRQMATQPHYMADVVSLTPEDRALSIFRLRSAIRVDEPVFFEHWSQVLGPLGVVPFPGSEQFDGVTPLWVESAFISQHSRHPHAVWEWLKFLSYLPPAPGFRLIPARPSTAQQTGYWTTLPRPLNEAMRAAFPFARPVTLADQVHFGWEQLTAVTTHQLTPEAAARRPAAVIWFTPP